MDAIGKNNKDILLAFRLSGATGAKYGTPNDRKEAKWATITTNPSRTAYSPKKADIIIRINRNILVAVDRLYDGCDKICRASNRYNNNHNV